jgi:hypothetical protein
MRPFALAFVLFLVLAAGSALAQDIAGIYATQGSNPGGGGQYAGETEIARTGETYRVVAQVGTTAVGTGVFLDGVLSVTFPEAGWIASYALQPDGSLVGIWAQAGGTRLGQETLVPMR